GTTAGTAHWSAGGARRARRRTGTRRPRGPRRACSGRPVLPPPAPDVHAGAATRTPPLAGPETRARTSSEHATDRRAAGVGGREVLSPVVGTSRSTGPSSWATLPAQTGPIRRFPGGPSRAEAGRPRSKEPPKPGGKRRTDHYRATVRRMSGIAWSSPLTEEVATRGSCSG